MEQVDIDERLLGDVDTFSREVTGTPLRPYQLEPARAIVDSVFQRKGLTFSILMSRQAGKNELSAQLEAYLLAFYRDQGGNIIKCAPTFNPQILHSRQRLAARLAAPMLKGKWNSSFGRAINFGKASVLFFSAEASAHVVGATAHLLLEVDEAQDVEEDKYLREFRPMGATTNCTTVLYGTPWDSGSLLERAKAEHLAQEAEDGIRRHFEYPWTVVAEHNPDYARYVQAEITRLGVDHPAIRTQYLLESLETLGRLFTEDQLALLAGRHPRLVGPKAGARYVAGVDVAGGVEQDDRDVVMGRRGDAAKRDSTVVTVAELRWVPLLESHSGISFPLLEEPRLEVVAHYRYTGLDQTEQVRRLVTLLRDQWGCARVVLDATGIGAGLADFLVAGLGRQVVERFTFSAASKSRLGYGLLAAVNGGRLKLYAERGTSEARACWEELRNARRALSAHETLNFYVPPNEGHDDFLVSLALVVEAGRLAPVRKAIGHRVGAA